MDCAVYMYGGENGATSGLWKLCKLGQKLEWNFVDFNGDTSPCNRSDHCMWEYGKKLWTFGGTCSEPQDGFDRHGEELCLHSKPFTTMAHSYCNQLNVFDPESRVWQNKKSKGRIPSPRAFMAQEIVGKNALLYGGSCNYERFSQLYQLDIKTLTWTEIHIGRGMAPRPFDICTFTALPNNRLLLYGSHNDYIKPESPRPLWIFYVTTESWTEFEGKENYDRCEHTATRVNNSILVVGGYNENPVSDISWLKF